jgi:hypothetical protein
MSIRSTVRLALWHLRHPTAALPPRGDRYTARIFIADTTRLIPDRIDLATGTTVSGVHIATGGWHARIHGDAEHLRFLAHVLNDRADLCDNVTAILAAGGTPTNGDLDIPAEWCPTHADNPNKYCWDCQTRPAAEDEGAER